MELRHLRYFVAVAEERSFSRAARSLHVSQSAISEQIAGLEEEIGARLFDRSSRETALTESGKVFHEHATIILEQARNAVLETQRVEQGEIGSLRIGFFAGGVGDGFPGLIRSFRATHPHVELSLVEMIAPVQWAALIDGSIDIAITRMPQPQFRNEIRHEVIQQDPIVAVLPRSHRRAHVKQLDLRDLSQERFVFSSRDISPAVYDKAIELCADAGFVPVVGSLSTVWSSVILMVRSGEGVSLLPVNQQQGAASDLAFVPLKARHAYVELCLCWLTRRDRPLVRSFRDLLHRHVRENGRL